MVLWHQAVAGYPAVLGVRGAVMLQHERVLDGARCTRARSPLPFLDWIQDCCVYIPFTAFTQIMDVVLLATSIGTFVVWLILPQSWWQGWLCGYSMLGAAILAFSLWRNTRAAARLTFERSATLLSEENAQLKQSSEQLSSDLNMLQDTIGAIGDKGDDWIGQLRFLYQAQKRENDRHSLLLRGHARIVLLQLIQHFDSDHSLRLNQTELSAGGLPHRRLPRDRHQAPRGQGSQVCTQPHPYVPPRFGCSPSARVFTACILTVPCPLPTLSPCPDAVVV